MITTPRQALGFVRRHGIVTMTRGPSHASLVEAIAGPVTGSWWSHPKGKLIFRIADSIHDSPDVISLKLVEGRVTFVHRSLWPALARVVAGRRRLRISKLGAAARRLRLEVERRGTVRTDKASGAAASELEESLLVRSESVHTERGSHATELTPWRKVFDLKTLARARRLTLPEALGLLGLAAIP